MDSLINTTIVPKSFTREYLKEHGSYVFRDRELVVEKEEAGEPDNPILRFKLGDGIRPYSELPYISSIYALFPRVHLYNNDYSKEITIEF